MELQMKTNMTMHQLGLPQQTQGLTNHRPRVHRRRITDKSVPVVADGVTAPRVGTEVDIDMDLVAFENKSGTSKTPMLKLRYNTADKRWTQINISLAGMLAFFDTPPPDDCKRVRIVRLIPNGRACYVVPV